MAILGPTRYQKQLAARRKTSDITRLASQYQQNIQAVAGEYETAFSAYQKQAAETLAPYEAAVKTYQETTFPQYQEAANTYQQQADAYKAQLDEYNYLINNYIVNESGNLIYAYGGWVGNQLRWSIVDKNVPQSTSTVEAISYDNWYSPFYQESLMPANVAWQTSASNRIVFNTSQYTIPGTEAENWLYQTDRNLYRTDASGNQVYAGRIGYFQAPGATIPYEQITQKTLPEAFTLAPPSAPEAPPQMPFIEEFDTGKFEGRRAQIESEFKREVGERRGARLSAVSRKTARPLLQGS